MGIANGLLHAAGLLLSPLALLAIALIHAVPLTPTTGLGAMILLLAAGLGLPIAASSLWSTLARRVALVALGLLGHLLVCAGLLAVISGPPSLYGPIRGWVAAASCVDLVVAAIAGVWWGASRRRWLAAAAAALALPLLGGTLVVFTVLALVVWGLDEHVALHFPRSHRVVEVITKTCAPPDNECECRRHHALTTRVFVSHDWMPWTLARHHLDEPWEASANADGTVTLRARCDERSDLILDPATGALGDK